MPHALGAARPAAQAGSCPQEPVLLPLHACLTPAGVTAAKDAVAVLCNLHSIPMQQRTQQAGLTRAPQQDGQSCKVLLLQGAR